MREGIMKFAAIIQYTQYKAMIAEIRPAHRQYLTSLLDSGQLAASGPFTDDSGALINYKAGDAAAAEKLLQADPFNKGGLLPQVSASPLDRDLLQPLTFPGKLSGPAASS
jgi:uncharacterized protein YciI